MSHNNRQRILFVCMGNICRSPLAEAVFRHKANERGVADRFRIDSAGTGGWHVGEPADPRMRQTARARGITITCRARQIKRNDADQFDLIICMDEANRRNVVRLGIPESQVRLLLDFHPDPETREVPDPYYGGDEGFELVFDLVETACDRLLDDLLERAPG